MSRELLSVELFLQTQELTRIPIRDEAMTLFADVVTGVRSEHGYTTLDNVGPPTENSRVEHIQLPSEVTENLHTFYQEFHADGNPQTNYDCHTTAHFLAGHTRDQEPIASLGQFNLNKHPVGFVAARGVMYCFARNSGLIRHSVIGTGSDLTLGSLGKNGPLAYMNIAKVHELYGTDYLIQVTKKQ